MILPTQEQEQATMESVFPSDSSKFNNEDLKENSRAYFRRHTASIDPQDVLAEGGIERTSDAIAAAMLIIREGNFNVEPLLEGEEPVIYTVRIRVPEFWSYPEGADSDRTRAWQHVIKHCVEVLSPAYTIRSNQLCSPAKLERVVINHEVVDMFTVVMKVVALDEYENKLF